MSKLTTNRHGRHFGVPSQRAPQREPLRPVPSDTARLARLITATGGEVPTEVLQATAEALAEHGYIIDTPLPPPSLWARFLAWLGVRR